MLNNPRSQDFIDAADPRDVARILRNAADSFFGAQGDLEAAWQDKESGKVWADMARILERAAASCERACAKRGV